MRFCFAFLLALVSGQVAHAQLSPDCWWLDRGTAVTVIGESAYTELYRDEGPRFSKIKIFAGIFNGETQTLKTPRMILVRHVNTDFELFPGQHVLHLHRGPEGGRWLLDSSSHGEIIDAEERQRRAAAAEKREHGRNPEREICYMKIKQAHDAEIFLGEFTLEDPEICEKYLAKYKEEFRLTP